MVSAVQKPLDIEPTATSPRIAAFSISGGIFKKPHRIEFPVPANAEPEPSVLILSGSNGSGKTTILKMIAGMLEMNFDIFRKIPFQFASLDLSDGSSLTVHKTQNPDFPLRVTFGNLSVELFKIRSKSGYPPDHYPKVQHLRQHALATLGQINFELLDIHRSLALKGVDPDEDDFAARNPEGHWVHYKHSRPGEKVTTLSERVQTFMRDAQINYRRFFSAEELELLPRIVERFQKPPKPPTAGSLMERVRQVQNRFSVMKRFGLQTDDADLKALIDLLEDEHHAKNPFSLTVIEAYVETQETRNKARELIAKRLLEFESIMDEFLVGKFVRIDARSGLRIQTKGGTALTETELSSGEYHFLYMMVTALLCQRLGSIIAIDEPELSLHVTWQRRVLSALARCAAGAAPLFVFATHSPAISAEHSDKIYELSAVEG